MNEQPATTVGRAQIGGSSIMVWGMFPGIAGASGGQSQLLWVTYPSLQISYNQTCWKHFQSVMGSFQDNLTCRTTLCVAQKAQPRLLTSSLVSRFPQTLI